MAVINDTGDKMRDIIAKAAEGLTTDDGAETEVAEGAEEVPDAGATADESSDGVIDGAEGDSAAADAEADAAAAGAGKGAAGDVGAGKTETAAEKDAKAAAAAAAETGKTGADGKAGKGKKDEEHPFAKEHGIKSKDSMGRENRIPFSRVIKINENAVKKARGDWDTTVLKPVAAKVKVYEDRLTSIGETEKIMFEQPRRYVAMLTSIPGYKALFDEISGGKFSVDGKTASERPDGTNIATDANDPMPTADAKDATGKVVGWTHEGMEKRFAWERRQAAREGAAAAKADFEKEFKPVKERLNVAVANEQTESDINSIIGMASAWPGFKENYAAILDVVSKGSDPLDTPRKMYDAVQAAYHDVMFGALTKTRETEEQARERYFAEFQQTLRKAPRSTSTASSVARREPVTEDENISPDDRMRNLILESTRKAGLIK